jgi:hypothetical protein
MYVLSCVVITDGSSGWLSPIARRQGHPSFPDHHHHHHHHHPKRKRTKITDLKLEKNVAITKALQQLPWI